jgi:hypothetical protein
MGVVGCALGRAGHTIARLEYSDHWTLVQEAATR